MIPVVILTTDDFDATTVDPQSVVLGPGAATESHGRGHIEDVENDGDLDLVLHFNTQHTGILCGDTFAFLTGETFDGQLIQGSDSINTVGCIAHDLAITKIKAPKKVTLTDEKPERTKRVKVQIQNRSQHDEVIEDMAMLGDLVSLAVESLGTCPAPIAVLHSGKHQKQLPLTLKPKKKLNVVFDVTFNCANDPAKSSKEDLGHEDYRYTATVGHSALDGVTDDHPVDDVCPRSVTPPFEIDPNPDGKIKDKGCGKKEPDKTRGADVLTDVEVK